MKVDDALRGVSRLFLDSAPVIYYVERHSRYGPIVDRIFKEIDGGNVTAVTSPVTLAECLIVPLRTAQTKLQQNFRDLIIAGHGVTHRTINAAVAEEAADLRARYNIALTDAFQVAIALIEQCDALLTNDAILRRVREVPVILLGDLEL